MAEPEVLTSMKRIFVDAIENFVYLRSIGFDNVHFQDPQFAFNTAVIIGALLLSGLVLSMFSRKKQSRMCSGHFSYRTHNWSLGDRVRQNFLTLVLAALASLLLVVVLADPHYNRTVSQKVQLERRRIVVLIDASVSVGWEYLNANMSYADLLKSKLLNFFETRKDKNDSVSLWLFSTNAYMIRDFSSSHELRVLDLLGSADVLSYPGHSNLPGTPVQPNDYPKIITREEKIIRKDGESGTRVDVALDAVADHFENADGSKFNGEAVVVVTDAMVDKYPGEQLERLKKNSIRPYFVFMYNYVYDAFPRLYQSAEKKKNHKLLKENIGRFSGRMFDATNPGELDAAYSAIDNLEQSPYEETQTLDKMFLSKSVLMIDIALWFAAIASGTIARFRRNIYP